MSSIEATCRSSGATATPPISFTTRSYFAMFYDATSIMFEAAGYSKQDSSQIRPGRHSHGGYGRAKLHRLDPRGDGDPDSKAHLKASRRSSFEVSTRCSRARIGEML